MSEKQQPQMQQLKLQEIEPYENNPRKNKDAIEIVKASIGEFDFLQPIVVDANKVIVVGHTRYFASQEMGLETVPVIVADHLTPAQAKAYRIMDNKSGEFASWNYGLLTKEIVDLLEADYDPTFTGFTDEELQDIDFNLSQLGYTEGLTDDEEIPETPEQPTSKKGDVWLLGEHRLMCGDSTEQGEVEKLMLDKKADMILTDPPWNVSYGKTSHPTWKKRQILNDSMGVEEWATFVKDFCSTFFLFTESGSMIYVFMSAQEWPVVDKTLRLSGFHWSSTIIWVKDSLVLSRKDYHTQYEPIWYGWNGEGPRTNPLKDRKQSDVWECERPRVSDLHPTTKPVELLERAIFNSTKKNEIVADFFMGSGSTLIAAEKTKRICYGIELDPKYCDVVVQRWQNFTGSDATLEGGDKTYNEMINK